MFPVVEQVLSHCDRWDPGGVVGVYLYGSSVTSGVRPDSDIDLLLITETSLSAPERTELTDLLLRYSGSAATMQPGRPVELTSVVRSSVAQWPYPPLRDYQYGEWERAEIAAGQIPQPQDDPDVVILAASAREHSRRLRGPALRDVLDPVPAPLARRAIVDDVALLFEGFVGDERNVLLTLARMIVTLESGEIVAKDVAVQRVKSRLAEPECEIMELARRGYLGEVTDDWTAMGTRARDTADRLAGIVIGG